MMSLAGKLIVLSPHQCWLTLATEGSGRRGGVGRDGSYSDVLLEDSVE